MCSKSNVLQLESLSYFNSFFSTRTRFHPYKMGLCYFLDKIFDNRVKSSIVYCSICELFRTVLVFYLPQPCWFRSRWAFRDIIKLSASQHALQSLRGAEISAESLEIPQCLHFPNEPWHVIPFVLLPRGCVGPINKQPIKSRGQSNFYLSS